MTKFKKKFILPIKWWLEERKKLKDVVVPTKRQILDMRRDLEIVLRKHQRDRYIEGIHETMGKISILDWLLNG